MRNKPKRFILFLLSIVLSGNFIPGFVNSNKVYAQEASRDYPVKPVPFTSVHLTDQFWAPKIEINRTVTIPFAFQQCELSGRYRNFDQAAAAIRGVKIEDKQIPGYPFDDTDPYKVIEGAAYALSVNRDQQLEAYVDNVISKIVAAQEPDGYLYPARTIDPAKPHDWAGTRRWEKEQDLSHELYNFGHLYEAATAYYQATGKRQLLDVALKTADLLDKTFGPDKQAIWPGHQITEMGLAKLYRATGDQRYINLAKFMIDVRGPNTGVASGNEYNQSHKKVLDQNEAVGHAVRATYMYSGMADVAALTGDKSYIDALNKIWDNVVNKKLYITGGIGSTNHGEAFGKNYELPNMTAYNETCAAIGNDYWNHRLFLLHADAKYIDVMERTLYNGLISGVSLDGKTFFYPNPLESKGQHARSPWFGCACCPGNITRFIASVPGYVYAQKGDAIFINLFAAGNANIEMDDKRKIKIVQETNYPWNGNIKMTVNPETSGNFTVNVRIPGWARNEPVPGDLYKFADKNVEPVTLKINGQKVEYALTKGYAPLTREWKKGDVIELALPMPVRRVTSHELVSTNKDRVSLQRGPVVYCAEWPDNPGKQVRNIMLSDDAKLSADYNPSFLNGVVTIKSKAIAFSRDKDGKVIKTNQDFTAIPYYAWANRGKGEMIVWLPNNESIVKPASPPTIASLSNVTVSSEAKNPGAINDLSEPASSIDRSETFMHWWPKNGTTEFVEYKFDGSHTISESEVYWFVDAPEGGCSLPASWKLLYKDGNQWKPVENTIPYTIEKNKFNKVTFKAVTTTAFKLEVTLQGKSSAGIHEWKVK